MQQKLSQIIMEPQLHTNSTPANTDNANEIYIMKSEENIIQQPFDLLKNELEDIKKMKKVQSNVNLLVDSICENTNITTRNGLAKKLGTRAIKTK